MAPHPLHHPYVGSCTPTQLHRQTDRDSQKWVEVLALQSTPVEWTPAAHLAEAGNQRAPTFVTDRTSSNSLLGQHRPILTRTVSSQDSEKRSRFPRPRPLE